MKKLLSPGIFQVLPGKLEHEHTFLQGKLLANLKQVKKIMDSIENTLENENRIILATGKYLGEGFDLPSLDTLFLVFPFSWRGMLIQYTGRLNRTFQGKSEIRVYNFVDWKEPVLLKMYGRRLKGYKSIGFTVTNEMS